MSGRTYDRDEVEAILKVALERADTVEGLTRAELSEVAAEVGIPVTDLDGAIELIEREREVQASMTQIVAERRRGFYWALGNATIVTSFLAVIDFVQGPGWWVPYVAAAWGMALTFRGRRAFFAPSEDIEKLARKRLAKEWRKRDWKKRERELPKAVEAGAAALIEAAARKIAERIEQAGTRPPQGAQQRVRVDPAPKAGRQVRVDASGAPTEAGAKEAELERDTSFRAHVARQREQER
ncbi:MAG: 2TM domain-containing protein [Sandaracinaceae bacterium]|nr:2TM domain-containing protein [Sandaracinaceae bacterium]